jgi:phospholipase A-2-activating protein
LLKPFLLQATAEVRAAYAEKLEAITLAAQQVTGSDNMNTDQLAGPDFLQRNRGKREGQTVMIKNGSDVEAYQWSETKGIWQMIGKVVGNAGGEKKKTLKGKSYDYVFDVELQEGVPPMKLGYNKGGTSAEALFALMLTLILRRESLHGRAAVSLGQ